MSNSEDYYWSEKYVRTLEQKEIAGKSKSNFGCVQQPLLNIPLENIRDDELHLLLRILVSIQQYNECALYMSIIMVAFSAFIQVSI